MCQWGKKINAIVEVGKYLLVTEKNNTLMSEKKKLERPATAKKGSEGQKMLELDIAV